MNPSISVIIPVYPNYKHIRRAVNSIRKQRYKNVEIIIVVDGIKEKLNIHGCKVIYHSKNEGTYKAYETGVKESSGEYIQFLDDDDVISIATFRNAIDRMQQFKADVVTYNMSTNIYDCNDVKYGHSSIMNLWNNRAKPPTDQNLKPNLYKRDLALKAMELLNVTDYLFWGEDILLNKAIMSLCNIWVIDESIGMYVVHRDGSNVSARISNEERLAQIKLVSKYMRKIPE